MEKTTQADELVMSLVELALTRPEGEREVYLRGACGNNSELFSKAWHYVEWENKMKGFLLEPLHPSAEYDHPFEPGQILINRFRIVREVAHGGMGVVYDAMDQKLDRRVAIKCAKSGFRKQLPPEVRHAREISHPNVCKIFEIHTASTSRGEIDFISMEFLEGETLAERLGRAPLRKAEARTIALQLCAGLAEAHRNNVIHGDLKSNNVILTTGPDKSIRAVIMDFGLAHMPERFGWIAWRRCARWDAGLYGSRAVERHEGFGCIRHLCVRRDFVGTGIREEAQRSACYFGNSFLGGTPDVETSGRAWEMGSRS